MARPKKQPQFKPAGFDQAVRAKFIQFGQIHNARALRLLATKVWLGELSLQDWAGAFSVSGTWVEQWAQDAIDSWRAWELNAAVQASREKGGWTKPWWIMVPHDPAAETTPINLYRALPAPRVLESGEMEMWYPPPRSTETDDDLFSCTLEDIPIAQQQHGITIGRDVSEFDGEAGFRRYMHRKLDSALDQFFLGGPAWTGLRAAKRIPIPADLDLKIEVAAMYVFCGNTRDELVAALKPESPHVGAEALYGWLKEAMRLLDLKMRLPGHRSILQ